jgi:hypothetical protein
MKTSTTYMNEFTGEVFTDKRKCEQAEAESKKDFVNNLIADIELIKDICNSHPYCENCPFSDGSGDCIADAFTDKYFEIVRNLQRIND